MAWPPNAQFQHKDVKSFSTLEQVLRSISALTHTV
jgi:hypothetical protein